MLYLGSGVWRRMKENSMKNSYTSIRGAEISSPRALFYANLSYHSNLIRFRSRAVEIIILSSNSKSTFGINLTNRWHRFDLQRIIYRAAVFIVICPNVNCTVLLINGSIVLIRMNKFVWNPESEKCLLSRHWVELIWSFGKRKWHEKV